MMFFQKYRELFGITQRQYQPTAPLTLNNELFITKEYLPTYQHQYAIQNKVRQFKKDYNELNQKISPNDHRKSQHSKNLRSKTNEYSKEYTKHAATKIRDPILQSDEYSKDYAKYAAQNMRDPITHSVPLPRQRDPMNVVKLSQIDYLFNSKLPSPMPEVRAKLLPRPSSLLPLQAPPKINPTLNKKQNYTDRSADMSIQRKGELLMAKKNVKERRAKAKSDLPSRRGRLKKLLETQW